MYNNLKLKGKNKYTVNAYQAYLQSITIILLIASFFVEIIPIIISIPIIAILIINIYIGINNNKILIQLQKERISTT